MDAFLLMIVISLVILIFLTYAIYNQQSKQMANFQELLNQMHFIKEDIDDIKKTINKEEQNSEQKDQPGSETSSQ